MELGIFICRPTYPLAFWKNGGFDCKSCNDHLPSYDASTQEFKDLDRSDTIHRAYYFKENLIMFDGHIIYWMLLTFHGTYWKYVMKWILTQVKTICYMHACFQKCWVFCGGVIWIKRKKKDNETSLEFLITWSLLIRLKGTSRSF